MKRIAAIILSLLLGFGVLFAAYKIFNSRPATHTDEHGHGHAEEEEVVKGPHGGRLLGEKDFQAEITIYEPAGLEPNFRVYFYADGKPLDPAGITLTLSLQRINRVDRITFEKEGMFLAGQQPAVEPHSFSVQVEARRGAPTYRWKYESMEGRVTMSEASRQKAGIELATAGPAKLAVKLDLNGKIAPNEEKMSHVIPRFPGVLKSVAKRLGDAVAAGEVLATVESNESLQTYEIKAEIAGTVIRKDATLGEFVSGQEPIFTVADLSTVWADFSVYRQDFPLLREGQSIVIDGGAGLEATSAKIDYISPFGSENSQTMLARAVASNPSGAWRPGLFVRGKVLTDETTVPVAVEASALQTFRDWDVVFIRVGELFEA
ncbi:MAG: efflux RND transporter periplasmic adaptor subunit, partial [Spartobacteria bacterium]